MEHVTLYNGQVLRIKVSIDVSAIVGQGFPQSRGKWGLILLWFTSLRSSGVDSANDVCGYVIK